MRLAIAARIPGAVYLAYFVTTLAGAALAPRPGFALALASTVLYLAVVVLLYRLFAPVDGKFAALALMFGTVGSALIAIGNAFQLAALSSTAELAGEFVKLYSAAYHVALPFFGMFELFLGYLIYRSTLVPRWIGVLISLAGLGWLAFLAPDVPRAISVPVAVFGGLAEVLLMLWLLIAGNRLLSPLRTDALSRHQSALTE